MPSFFTPMAPMTWVDPTTKPSMNTARISAPGITRVCTCSKAVVMAFLSSRLTWDLLIPTASAVWSSVFLYFRVETPPPKATSITRPASLGSCLSRRIGRRLDLQRPAGRIGKRPQTRPLHAELALAHDHHALLMAVAAHRAVHRVRRRGRGLARVRHAGKFAG